jgi:hypothetical protein
VLACNGGSVFGWCHLAGFGHRSSTDIVRTDMGNSTGHSSTRMEGFVAACNEPRLTIDQLCGTRLLGQLPRTGCAILTVTVENSVEKRRILARCDVSLRVNERFAPPQGEYDRAQVPRRQNLGIIL